MLYELRGKCVDWSGSHISNTGTIPQCGRHESAGRLLPEPIPCDEQSVRWPFRQAAHEVGIPLCAKRNVDAHAPSLAHQALLQIAADTVEHLELESVARNVLPGGEGF